MSQTLDEMLERYEEKRLDFAFGEFEVDELCLIHSALLGYQDHTEEYKIIKDLIAALENEINHRGL